MNERKHPLTDYGIKVKIELAKRGVTQNWLINEIKAVEPGSSIDTSLMTKLLTGQPKKSKYHGIINNILGIADTEG